MTDNRSSEVVVDYMRHLPQVVVPGKTGWIPEAPLHQDSYATANRIRETHLNGMTYNLVGGSPFLRAHQTGQAVVPSADYFEMEAFGPGNLDAWAFLNTLEDQSPAGCYAAAPDLMAARGALAFDGITSIVRRFGPGARILLVSHSPLVEITLAAMLNQNGPVEVFGKGEIVRLKFSPAGLRLGAPERLPVPTA